MHLRKIGKYINNTFNDQAEFNMIQGIIGPVCGTIQIWYKIKQMNQTISLLKVLKIELARNMTEYYLKLTFTNPGDLIRLAHNTSKWTPNSLIISIPSADQYSTYGMEKDTKVNRKGRRSWKYTDNKNETEILGPSRNNTSRSPYNTKHKMHPGEVNIQLAYRTIIPNPLIQAPIDMEEKLKRYCDKLVEVHTTLLKETQLKQQT
jgi:hypothetical protein